MINSKNKEIKKKKILLLGGSQQQVIAIEEAKKLGYTTILCDFLPDNPGKKYADIFYLASTTDKKNILNIAKKEKIDGILAYASDPAAPTAAYVAEKLDLPGNPYKSVNILCNKDKFRKFLRDYNFNVPFNKSYINADKAINDIENEMFNMPVVVKPVDSSGSKGVSLIENTKNIKRKIADAFKYSRRRKIIIEEFIKQKGYQVAGDGLSLNGKLVFAYFGNDHFDKLSPNPFVPVAASFPCLFEENIQNKIKKEVQRLITLLNIKNCTFNFDIKVSEDNKIYLMEVAPRNGGNYIPQIIKYSTDIDLVKISIEMTMGSNISLIKYNNKIQYYAYYSIHSYKSGVLEKIEYSRKVEKENIIEKRIVAKKDQKIKKYKSSNCTLGCLLMKFDSMNELLEIINNSNKWLEIVYKV